MNSITINPAGKLSGRITVPSDKSISHRAIMLGSLAQGQTIIKDALLAEDYLRTINAFQAMGVHIKGASPGKRQTIEIKGVGAAALREPAGVIDAGNSGTTMRLLSGILAGQGFSSTLTGDDSLRKRPMKRIIEPLRQMGAEISGDGDYPPLTICGRPLHAIDYQTQIPSAQVKSAILLAGLFADGQTSVEEPALSRDHMERMLTYFGVGLKRAGLKVTIEGRQTLHGRELSIPGDISSASFFMIGAAILPGSKLSILDAGVNPARTGVLNVLRQMGAAFSLEDLPSHSPEPSANITIKSSTLKPLMVDREAVPSLIDELPILALAATQAEGRSVIYGAGELRVKETDRISVLAANLRKLGARIDETDDGMAIYGRAQLRGGDVQSLGDHRMAMTMAVAGLIAKEPITVHGTDCINTSFPGFLDTLHAIT